jgi:putative molybdopterin biosynthesis protein
MEMDFRILPGDSAYSQVAEHVRLQVALGKLKPDDRLPAIREFARRLRLDPGTVARAYRELEHEGIIATRRGRGSFVSADVRRAGFAGQRQKRLGVAVEKSIMEALGLGFTVEDIEAAFTVHLAAWRERRAPGGKKRSRRTGRNIIRFRGSHDIAVELLALHLGTLGPAVHVTTDFVGSLAGLVALASGEADITGAHLIDEESGEYNVPFVKKLMPNETVTLINLVQRIQGLMVKSGNPEHIIGVRDLGRKEITFVNRQKGSGTRILLDSQLRKTGIPVAHVKGYGREETTHSAVAAAVARGEADAGLGAQAAASAAGLDFIPLVKERYDLIMLEDRLNSKPYNLVPEVLRSREFHSMLESIPGYDISETGTTVTVRP